MSFTTSYCTKNFMIYIEDINKTEGSDDKKMFPQMFHVFILCVPSHVPRILYVFFQMFHIFLCVPSQFPCTVYFICISSHVQVFSCVP